MKIQSLTNYFPNKQWYNTQYNSAIPNNAENKTLNNTQISKFPKPLLNKINISFQAKNGSIILLNELDKLKCAYLDMPLLKSKVVENINNELIRTDHIPTIVEKLAPYEEYMHKNERLFFNILQSCDSSYKSIKSPLHEMFSSSLTNLIRKEEVLCSADKIIKYLPPKLKTQVINIRDGSLERIKDNKFWRQIPLTSLENIETNFEQKDLIWQIYKSWYKLPCSSKDWDAFVVCNTKSRQSSIIPKFLNPSIGTIEHITPLSRAGEDELGNMIPVSADINNARKSMVLFNFIELNDDIKIPSNLKKYYKSISELSKNKKSGLYQHKEYPSQIAHNILLETAGLVNLHP